MTEKTLGLYFHFPFCISKCPYCDFYSQTNSKIAARYTEALISHMEDYSSSAAIYDVDTVFFGGGTPTAIPTSCLLEVIYGIKDNFSLRSDAEFTIEANPATVKAQELKKLRRAGVNRISFGLQSSHDSELKALSRIHSYSEFLSAYSDARDAGFDNINIDLMYGLPDQTVDSFAETVERVSALSPEHLSLYGLKIEDGTPFGRMRDRLVLPDEDSEYEMYLMAADLLRAAGCAKISNLASNIASAVVWVGNGFIMYELVLPAIVSSVLGNYLGAKYAIRGGSKRIRGMIFVVLGLLFLKLLFDMIP